MSAHAIAERHWIAVRPDGTEQPVTLRVSAPQQQSGGDWAALVEISPIQSAHSIHGIDSWQAVQEGMRHIASGLEHYRSSGWRFYWERGSDETTTADLGGIAPGANR